MSTQQDIYSAGSKNRPPMLNKDNYVPWSSCLLYYAKSKPNGKLIYNSIMHGPYVRRIIPEPGDPNRKEPVAETFHEQTVEKLTEKEVKQMEADDQAIQNILTGLLEDIYAAVDSCKTAQEIWLRIQQMMKGSDIGIQEKKSKLFNEWERFTSTDGESIESYYHRLSKLMNDFKRNKHFPEKIVEVNELRAERLARAHDPLALMAISNNPYNYSMFHQDQPSQIAQPSMNLGQDRQMQMIRGNGGNRFRQYAGKNVGNQTGGMGHLASNYTVGPRRRDDAYLQTQLLIAQKEEAWIQLQAEEFDLLAGVGDLDEIEEVNANCILMANLQQALTSGTQTDKAPVYDSDGSVEVHEYENCYNNEIFNMFTQEEQYAELLDPISEPHQVQQNDTNLIFVNSSMEPNGGTVEQHYATIEETRAYFESLYNNLAIKVEKVNSVNHKMKETMLI
ncbi:hypothetical protein Tco_1312964 [Tanacetum coccineum]